MESNGGRGALPRKCKLIRTSDRPADPALGRAERKAVEGRGGGRGCGSARERKSARAARVANRRRGDVGGADLQRGPKAWPQRISERTGGGCGRQLVHRNVAKRSDRLGPRSPPAQAEKTGIRPSTAFFFIFSVLRADANVSARSRQSPKGTRRSFGAALQRASTRKAPAVDCFFSLSGRLRFARVGDTELVGRAVNFVRRALLLLACCSSRPAPPRFAALRPEGRRALRTRPFGVAPARKGGQRKSRASRRGAGGSWSGWSRREWRKRRRNEQSPGSPGLRERKARGGRGAACSTPRLRSWQAGRGE